MATISINNGAFPKKRKRNNKTAGGIPLILPGSTAALSAVVTPEAALKVLGTLQFIPEHTAVQPAGAVPPTGLTSEVTQGDTSGQGGTLLDEVTNLDADMITAVDDELEQAELLLEETNRALESRSLALSTAEGLLAKRLKIKAIQHELAISQAKMAQVESDAAEFIITTQSKEAEASRIQLDAKTTADALLVAQAKTRSEAEAAKAQKEVQNKSQRSGADAVDSPGKSGDQKAPFNLNNSIITSTMNVGLSNLTERPGLGGDQEGKTPENPDLLTPLKVKELPPPNDGIANAAF